MSLLDRLGDTPAPPRIEDPRARFYLDNYRTIETWAALQREAGALLAEGLLDLTDVFATDAERLGERLDVVPNDRGTRVILRRPQWIPGVGVGLEWAPGVFDRQANVSLYAGLQHEPAEVPEGHQRRLAEVAAATRSTLGSPWTSGKGAWLLWRWIRPDDEPLDELALYALVRREVWRCWEATAPVLDALGEAPAAPIPPESPRQLKPHIQDPGSSSQAL